VEVIEERYYDQTSIDTYGRNPGNNSEPMLIENDLIQDFSTAHSLAYTLVKEHKDPHRRYEAPIFANPAHQIDDFISVTNADTGETKNMYLTGYKISRGRNGELRQSVELEERTIKQYFQIGVSAIGGSHEIAP
jgi:hypothetical protein